ncbi:uncharacterized protein VP01_1725g6 [Puccinia sorghi]|uniref:Uncharacterized protein n=1 Tax=Puccinia sorghi TaxID=27349 RepID=A0A0L6VFG4_9BASI|nr:uncharacterized protein VP01_1725g6 [Puccinia sorghi]
MPSPSRSGPEPFYHGELSVSQRPHRRLPRYMAKRPLLTIVIPTLMERIGKEEERAQEVSCFSPFTPESSRSEAGSCTGEEVECKTGEDLPDPAGVVDVDQQTMLKMMVEQEEHPHRNVPRFGTRWSRRLQQSCLQPIFHLALQGTTSTPPRRRRLATLSAIPCSQIHCENQPPSLPGNPTLFNSRRTSNPFDYRSTLRPPKTATLPARCK